MSPQPSPPWPLDGQPMVARTLGLVTIRLMAAHLRANNITSPVHTG
jgi:hypothetical protein